MTHGGNVWQGAPRDWLDFSANLQPDPPEWVMDALRRALPDVRYYPDPQMTEAKKGLAAFLGLSPEQVLPTAGGVSAMRMAAHLGERGALLLAPCFTEYERFLALAGKTIRTVRLLDGHRPLAIAPLVEAHMQPGDSVWLGNPNNPTGGAIHPEELRAILRLVEARRGLLVLDEAFIQYCPAFSAVPLLAGSERLVILGSLTKTLCIPGVRLGYMAASPALLERAEPHRVPWEVSCFATAVLRALPEHRDELTALAEDCRARREALAAGLAALGAAVYPSEAPYLLADMGRPALDIAEGLRARGILARTCLDFEDLGDTYLRFAVKDAKANARLLGALKEVCLCGERR